MLTCLIGKGPGKPSWIINKVKNLGKEENCPGKQNLRVTCPMGKLEFKFLSSPDNTT